jgi:hypothetical protein
MFLSIIFGAKIKQIVDVCNYYGILRGDTKEDELNEAVVVRNFRTTTRHEAKERRIGGKHGMSEIPTHHPAWGYDG